ncbi:MAG: LPS export ABC transporter periplasmic protein LptC [Candidatus Eremiobacteraeota bacterium]|nr:LPS export ABC transporter periplasmic protein LptC [Candidatus Eremiobacteraeota bacterium]
MRLKRLFTLAAAWIAATAIAPPPAAPPASTAMKLGDCDLKTAAVDTNFQTGDFSIPSHIAMNCPTRDMQADRANGNDKKRDVTLYGHVTIHDAQGAASLTDMGTGSEGAQGPATLTSDQLNVNDISKVYTATGNVVYLQGTRKINADKGVLDDKTKLLTLYKLHFTQGTQSVDADQGVLNDRTHDLDLTGTVHVVDGLRSMDAEHVLYNTQNGTLHARGNVDMRFPGGPAPGPPGTPAPKKKHRLIPF